MSVMKIPATCSVCDNIQHLACVMNAQYISDYDPLNAPPDWCPLREHPVPLQFQATLVDEVLGLPIYRVKKIT